MSSLNPNLLTVSEETKVGLVDNDDFLMIDL